MRYCNWSTEVPRFERCRKPAEEGTYRCEEHQIKKPRRQNDMTQKQRKEIWDEFGGVCAMPGCSRPGHEVDHIRELNDFEPWEIHRANMKSNLQLLCFEHHLVKTNEYRRSLIVEPDANDRSTSARNRKKLRRKRQGFYY